jgi:hypothetical protein
VRKLLAFPIEDSNHRRGATATRFEPETGGSPPAIGSAAPRAALNPSPATKQIKGSGREARPLFLAEVEGFQIVRVANAFLLREAVGSTPAADGSVRYACSKRKSFRCFGSRTVFRRR